ncbi:DUF4350 domain-containing protein [Paeniglutamicibacter cryotolerans]|uniref:DUF4350 domain-containing protein n=1 Tax=Paeniglutamicibacter cryotolerans TaxID=670079 RepID=A0A839QLC0_9MICC|nr:DUF4350 domain-containing protein [Paeniglutamicibacter cryotolerans]MBB2996600.1 hypothetical protein [Paeniglutamicibacter cryotolerans]
MSAPQTPATAPAKPVPARQRLRRPGGLFWILLLVAMLASGLLTMILSPASSERSLSPVNPAPRGAQAVARVLADKGVAVVQPDSLNTAIAALEAADGRATLLLHDPDGLLGPEQLNQLAAAAPRTVLVEPGAAALAAFAPGVTPADGTRDSRIVSASCAMPLAEAAPLLQATGRLYTGPLGCYPVPGTSGHPVVFSATATVLGSTSYLANRDIRGQGHSALALWTLGQEPQLIWYQPEFAELTADMPAPNPFLLLPGWFGPVMAWTLLMGLLAMFWRGRRLGPLVPERLPVVVPAAELIDGRARLYAHGRALDAVAANLRSGALTRMAHHYRLGTGAGVHQIIAAAEHAGVRTGPELDLLLNPAITSEQHLVAWANDLAQLEKEIGSP